MIAVLKYTDCRNDGKNVFRILASENVEILKTKTKSLSICPEITIRIKDVSELNSLMYALNELCIYEVTVIKTKSEKSFFERLRDLF